MENNSLSAGVGILTAIVGLAIVAVILSPKSDTSNVIGAGGSFFAKILNKAVSPVSN